MMCFYHDEYAEACVTVYPKARKSHWCSECGEEIPAGTLYTKTSGIFDGNPFTHKECRRCSYDRKRVIEHELSEGCRGNEAMPGMFSLRDDMGDMEMRPTAPEDVPSDFDPRVKINVFPKLAEVS